MSTDPKPLDLGEEDEETKRVIIERLQTLDQDKADLRDWPSVKARAMEQLKLTKRA